MQSTLKLQTQNCSIIKRLLKHCLELPHPLRRRGRGHAELLDIIDRENPFSAGISEYVASLQRERQDNNLNLNQNGTTVCVCVCVCVCALDD